MDLKGLNNTQIQKVLDYHTEEYTAKLWGQPHDIKPCLIEKIHGDGLQLVALTPIDTRPNYYVLRIDSSIDLDDDDTLNKEDREYYGSIMELLLQMVEEDHINIDSYEENNEGKYFDSFDETIEPFEYEFPMLSWGGGYWCNLKDCRKELKITN